MYLFVNTILMAIGKSTIKIVQSIGRTVRKHESKDKAIIFDIEQIFANVDLRYLKKIKYLGGEPFITPQIKDLFEYLDRMGIIQNLRFEYY